MIYLKYQIFPFFVLQREFFLFNNIQYKKNNMYIRNNLENI